MLLARLRNPAIIMLHKQHNVALPTWLLLVCNGLRNDYGLFEPEPSPVSLALMGQNRIRLFENKYWTGQYKHRSQTSFHFRMSLGP